MNSRALEAGLARTMWRWILLVAAAGCFVGLLYAYLPVGVDFRYQFWPIPREWLLNGQPAYGVAWSGFYNPPWTILMLLPFSLLPIRWGMVALSLFSVGSLLWTLRTFTPPQARGWVVLVVALCNLHTFDLLQRGQIDALPLLGLALAFQAVNRRRPWLLSVELALISTNPSIWFCPRCWSYGWCALGRRQTS